ncbi:MAG TPA: cupin domain-containing protein [Pseudonocardiaceae bacterium]|jgi:quercetin dioxygenase-like cupin family protein|nr:cupin domain-containing protein [Pseudonocardiaceae bacterium]
MAAVPSPPSLLIRPELVTPFDRGSGVTTLPYVGRWNSQTSSVTTGITVFEVGTSIPLHTHNVEENVLVLDGEATVTIGEDTFDVAAGVNTWVPAGVPHRFSNRGDSVMRIYWVYGGLEVTRTLCATGETFAHLSDQDRA